MDIITTARHFEMTPELRQYVEKRLERLSRYLGDDEEVYVVLTTEKYRQLAEISLRSRGSEIVSRGESDEMMTSVDRVVDRIERQIKRQAARRRDRGNRRSLKGEIPASIPLEPAEADTGEFEEDEAGGLDFDDDFSPVVIRDESFHPDPVSVETAIEAMHAQDRDYLLFRNKQTKKVNLVHLREDGNYSLIEAP